MLPGSSEPFAADTGLRRLDELESTRQLGEYRRRCLPSSQMPLRVGHLVPGGYAAYCRVLSPLLLTPREGAPTERARWSQVLAAPDGLQPGGLADGLRQAQEMLRGLGGRVEVSYGFLDTGTTVELIRRLGAEVGDGLECIYYFWSGRAVVGGPQGHSVYAGPLSAARMLVPVGHRGLETPSAIWPRDLSWCFAMHTDSPAAYLGGDTGLISALLTDEALEVAPVEAHDLADVWQGPG